MATQVYTNAYLSVAGNNVSTSVKSLELTYEIETVDDTTMGDTTRSAKPGLKNWSFNVNFAEDFAASALNSILWPLVGTVVAIEIRPDQGSVSTSNPKFTGNALFQSYSEGGEVGGFLVSEGSFVAAKGSGNANLTRATS